MGKRKVEFRAHPLPSGLIQSMRETDDKAFEELLTAKLESAT